MRRAVVVLALLLSACAGGGGQAGEQTPPGNATGRGPEPSAAAGFTVTSDAFGDGERIPSVYSCSGRNTPPPLRWSGVPGGTGSLALVVDDPDAVGGLFTHWVVTDLPPSATELTGALPDGAVVSRNSAGHAEYLGPCPPAGSGEHHYRFRLFALPDRLGLAGDTAVADASAAIGDAATAEARMVGVFGD